MAVSGSLLRLSPVALIVMIIVVAGVVLPAPRLPAGAAQSTCPTPVALTNGDFETPVIATGGVSIMSQTLVPGWLTTATDKMIELWRGYGGVPAGSGSQHAELNANQVSTLYQDLPTTPGQTLRWELKHRGRTGIDTMSVLIGAPAGTLVQQGPVIADGTSAWGTYAGVYSVPAGQTTTRFAFRSVASASTSPSIGNFLDAISFGSAACLVTTTAVADASGAATAYPGDVLTYTVTTRNAGGNPARLVTISDDLPANVTYVPGSLRSITGTTVVKPTDAAGDDTGEYDAATRTVRIRAGTGATATAGGVIGAADARTMTYQVTAGTAAAATTISDDAVAGYTDALSGNTLTSASDTAAIPVAAAANLGVTAAMTGSLVAGRATEYTVTATNSGPSAAASVQLSAAVPAALTGVAATSPGGTCSVGGGGAVCAYPSVAAGATRTVRITGTVPAAATAGTRYALTATATDTTFDLDTTDNAATVSNTVTTSADLAVTLTAPVNPVAGAPARYTATVTNTGPSYARDIVLTNPVPQGATYPSASSAGGVCSYAAAAHTLECDLADLAPGAGATATLDVTLPPNGGAEIDSAVAVTASTPDPVLTNNSAEVQSHDVEVADLGVGLHLDSATARPGDEVGYTLTVRNHGPSDAHAVAVNVTAPAGLTIVPGSGAGCTLAGCTIPTLTGNNVPVVLTGTVRIESWAAAGLAHAITTVVSPTADSNAANDTDTSALTIELSADLEIAHSVTGPAVAGERLVESLTVTNRGPTRAEGLVLTEHIPAGDVVPAAAAGAGSCRFQGAGGTGSVTADGGVLLCTLHDLAAAGTWQVTFTGTVAAGYPGTRLIRDAEVSAVSADPDPGDNSETDTIAVAHRADLAVTQTTSTPAVVQTDPVRFRATVRNAGPSDARNVILRAEPGTGLILNGGSTDHGGYDDTDHAWHLSELDAGDTAELDLTGTAHDAGTIVSTVRVTHADSTDPAGGNDSGTASVTVTPEAESLAVTISPVVVPAAHRGAVRAGDTVGFDYPVTNTGNVAISQIAVTTGIGGSAVCPSATLAAGASMTCRAGTPYPVTQADVDAGHPITNTAVVAGFGPGDTAATTFRAALADVPVVAAAPALTVAVAATVDPPARQNAAAAGDTISYRYTIANTGNVTVADPSVQATTGGTVTCPSGPVATGATVVCAGTPYTVSRADLDAGQPITETATARAATPADGVVTSLSPGTATVAVTAPVPALSMAVTATVNPAARQNAAQAGDTVTYQYSVTNTGNVTMDQITAAGSLGGALTCTPGRLAAGASATCTGAPYTVTRADLDAGLPVTETATVTGRSPAGVSAAFPPRSVAVPVAPAVPALTITITTALSPAAGQHAARDGDTIDYAYTVTNTGNVTITGVAVTASAGGPVTCDTAVLAAGNSATCGNASYPVTATDILGGGPITRTATASGTGPGATGTVTSPQARSNVALVVATASLAITVTPEVSPAARQNAARAGDTIDYRYTVTNNGTVTMDQITVAGTLGGAITCGSALLHPGQATPCTRVAYLISQADIDAGQAITETATVTGHTGGITASFPAHAADVHLAPAAPALNVTVAAAVSPVARQNAAQAGDTVTYRYTVTNTGNVTLDQLAVTDAPAGPVTCDTAALAVGGTATCVAARGYPVTPADLDAQVPVGGAAYATARTPSGGPLAIGPFAAPVMVARAAPELTVAVLPAVSPAARQNAAEAGDTVTYRYALGNTGNVTLDQISVIADLGGAVTCPQPALAAGTSMTCTAARVHTVTQADVDAGAVPAETATAAARAPGAASPDTHAPVSATVGVVTAAPALQVDAAATVDPPARQNAAEAGDTVTYRYTATNTGNVTTTALVVTDSTGGLAVCPIQVLAPDASVTCDAVTSHVVGQDEVDAGAPLTRTATATARGPGQAVVAGSAPATAVVPVAAAAPGLTLTVTPTVSPPARQNAAATGDLVRYRYTVANSGNVTMRAITVAGTRLGAAPCADTTLPVGATTTCRPPEEYRVTAADVDAGTPIGDSVSVSGSAPGAAATTFGPVTSAVPVAAAAPALRLAVTAVVSPAARQAAAQPGDTITYRYAVINEGNVTMSAITIGDAPVGPAGCPSDILAAGAGMTCLSTRSYRVTPDDAAAGTPVRNAAYVSGRPPGTTTALTSGPFSDPVEVTEGTPSLAVEVLADVDPPEHHGAVRAGDRVTYRYLVTNDGTLTMTGVTVTDTTAASGIRTAITAGTTAASGIRTAITADTAAQAAISCPSSSLAEGETMTCTGAGVHVITQEEIDSGRAVARTAAVAGVAPGADAPATFDNDEADVTVVPAAPAVAAEQHARWQDNDGDGELSAFEPVVSTVVVDNTGNVTLSGLTVTGLPAAVTCDRTVLPPAAEAICHSGIFHLTEAEIASGRHQDVARIAMFAPGGADEVDVDAPSVIVVPGHTPSPGISSSPTASPGPGGGNPGATTAPSRPATPGAPMPITGGDLSPLGLAGAGSIAAGLVLMLLARRPIRPRTPAGDEPSECPPNPPDRRVCR
ncbi:DUF7507 domain-containing protein [Actinoplanes sp. CA-015351]|uniref:DUF7507 domain-containing protein n=1 Tax=Actinoplanes sp. CA-015351 TaxID=3239897 RepID=UPI003D966854